MGASIGVLNQVLIELIDRHRQLLDLSREKKEILIRGSIDQLAEIVSQEGALIREVARLEAEREKLVSLLEETHGERSLTLLQFIERLPESAEKKELAENRGKLLDLIDELSRCNQINQQLIQQALSYVRHTLESAAGLKHKDLGLYQPSQNKGALSQSSDAVKYRTSGGAMFNQKV